jgi:transcriptional regulator with XRE-family HTH domain
MDRDYATQSERIAWAIEQSGRRLEDIAADVGCTHATLSQWQRGHTNMDHAKVGYLIAFARTTGVNLDWLLTGNGPRRDGIVIREPSPLVKRAIELENDAPGLADTAERLLSALLARPGDA